MNYFFWKFRREADRIFQQFLGCIGGFYEPFLQKRYDSQRLTILKCREGAIIAQEKIAILLLFQPAGISDSTLWTCQHLVAKGYAPLVVSNAPVSEEDQAKLKMTCWRLVERPNFGYDFGGYRDGIWLLNQWGITPDNLIILNDSIWFPIFSDETLIEEMEASPADFVGALQLDPLKKKYRNAEKGRPFFGSFFLMVKRKTFLHPTFATYWKNYRITSSKYKTIRRGERTFSHTIFDADILSAGIYTHQKLDHYLTSLTAEELCATLESLVSAHEDLQLQLLDCVAKFQKTLEWRHLALSLALHVTAKQNCMTTAPIISVKQFGVPYLKKSLEADNIKSLQLIEKKVRAGMLPEMKSCVFMELKKLIQLRS